MNKEYIKILLVSTLCILLMLLKPLAIFFLGEDVELKGKVRWLDTGSKNYVEYDIFDIRNQSNLWDDDISTFVIDNVVSEKDEYSDEADSVKVDRNKEAYLVLENVDGTYTAKRLTLEKPINELYLNCTIEYDYEDSFYVTYGNLKTNVSYDKLRLGKDIELKEENYDEIIEYKEVYTKIKVFNGEVFNY